MVLVVLIQVHVGLNLTKINSLITVNHSIISPDCRYILYLEPMTYGDAAAKCATLRDRNSPTGKGRIAVVRNSGENDELSSLLQHAFGYKLKVRII